MVSSGSRPLLVVFLCHPGFVLLIPGSGVVRVSVGPPLPRDPSLNVPPSMILKDCHCHLTFIDRFKKFGWMTTSLG